MEIYFYFKDDCHLCDQMAKELQHFVSGPGAGFDMSIISRDIEDNESWLCKYREYVPLLVANGQEVCHYFFDEQEMLEVLNTQSPPK